MKMKGGCHHHKQMNGICGSTGLSVNLAVAGPLLLSCFLLRLWFPPTRTPIGEVGAVNK